MSYLFILIITFFGTLFTSTELFFVLFLLKHISNNQCPTCLSNCHSKNWSTTNTAASYFDHYGFGGVFNSPEQPNYVASYHQTCQLPSKYILCIHTIVIISGCSFGVCEILFASISFIVFFST